MIDPANPITFKVEHDEDDQDRVRGDGSGAARRVLSD
jgi:hypothetical protein